MTLDLTKIEQQLGKGFSLEYHPELASTNDRALELARAGASHGTVVVTDFQTAGRGRRGAVWTAPAGSSALFSILLRPAVPIPNHHLAILTGVGAVDGLQTLGISAKIKWPNDVMVDDRKVAGILIETTGDAVVIGCGINCAVPEESFPVEIRQRAGSLHTLTKRTICREEVLATAMTGISEALSRVEAGGIIKVLYAWNSANWLSRRKVRVSGPDGCCGGRWPLPRRAQAHFSCLQRLRCGADAVIQFRGGALMRISGGRIWGTHTAHTEGGRHTSYLGYCTTIALQYPRAATP